jgi:hypothetical protein
MHDLIVVYDTFVKEEQLSFRIKELCPDALTILDTQDLHFLRKHREVLVQQGASIEEIFHPDFPKATWPEVDLPRAGCHSSFRLMFTRFSC